MRLATFLLLFWLLMTVCCTTCPRKSESLAGILRHRSTCASYAASQANATRRRVARASNGLTSNRRKNVRPVPESASSSRTSGYDDDMQDAPVHPPERSPSPIPPVYSPERSPSSIVPDPPALTPAGRPMRTRNLPKRFEDVLPVAPAPLPPPPSVPTVRRVILYVRDSMQTACDRFGIFRKYAHRPSYDPDHLIKPEDLANVSIRPADIAPDEVPESQEQPPPPWPFKNMSTYRLMNWANTGSNSKSEGEVTRLVAEVINAPISTLPTSLDSMLTGRTRFSIMLRWLPRSPTNHG
ncbi:hypothetical protein B0H14DRAFT_2625412 [Mycena olivaceomarginata]|nr:hypothetical protein B0H14DRAFT_2625412 [Mycena olivaceomarginata]